MRGLIDHELRRARQAGDGALDPRFRSREDVPNLVAGVQTLYKDKPLDISTDIDTPKRLPFDEEDMLELLGNLLDNAAKWARRRVRLCLRWGDGLQILVEDDGPGGRVGRRGGPVNKGEQARRVDPRSRARTVHRAGDRPGPRWPPELWAIGSTWRICCDH